MPEALQLSQEFNYALERMEAGANLFITGRAGTGKSTLLQIFKRSSRKNLVVLAPTGVAALNVGGQTIHSFFNFPPRLLQSSDVRPNRRNRRVFMNLETLVIDEISMVRADVLEAIDYGLKLNRESSEPFGGVQLIFFGDLYQLPPVVSSEAEREFFSLRYASPYFFSADALDHVDLETIELNKVYRQDSRHFLRLLESIRNASIDRDELEDLNQRCIPDFQPAAGENYLTLAARNATVTSINAGALAELETPVHLYTARVKGNFPEKLFPVPQLLKLKEGAQVMTLRNDPDRRFVNGSIGTIVQCKPESVVVRIVENGKPNEVEVEYDEWDIIRYTADTIDLRKIGTETLGTYRQLPVRLAWAVTIHKSQGKTFDKIIIDLGRSGAFEHGQTYVALSRCRTLEGIVLRQPLGIRDVLVDPEVVQFMEGSR